MVKQYCAFTLSQFNKAFFSWKAGAKVRPFRIQEERRKGVHLIIFTRALEGRGHGRMHKGKEEEIQER